MIPACTLKVATLLRVARGFSTYHEVWNITQQEIPTHSIRRDLRMSPASKATFIYLVIFKCFHLLSSPCILIFKILIIFHCFFSSRSFFLIIPIWHQTLEDSWKVVISVAFPLLIFCSYTILKCEIILCTYKADIPGIVIYFQLLNL